MRPILELFPESHRHHVRHAVPAALIAWLGVLLNDWHESSITRPKGHAYVLVLLGSSVCFVVGVVLATLARQKLIGRIREHQEATGELPSPAWIFVRGIWLGVVHAVFNLPAHLAFLDSHPLRVVVGFVIAGTLGGTWLARSAIVRELPERRGRAWAVGTAILPSAMAASVVGSVPVVAARFHLDGALDWSTNLDTFCGGVEVAQLAVVLVPLMIAFASVTALILFIAKALPLGKLTRLATVAALVSVIGVFANAVTKVLLVSPPRGCRATPWASTVDALAMRGSASYAHEVIFVSAVVAGLVVVAFQLVAARRPHVRWVDPALRGSAYRSLLI